MKVNESLDFIMDKWRISNVYLSDITDIHSTTLSRYRHNQRNIGKKSFARIYEALKDLEVNSKKLKELKEEYENSRVKKV